MSWNASRFINCDDFSIFVNNGDTSVYRCERQVKKPMPGSLKDHSIPLLQSLALGRAPTVYQKSVLVDRFRRLATR
jgi:hypothetical protein